MPRCARVTGFLLAVGAVMLMAAPAFAATSRDDVSDQIVITGSVDIRSGQVVDRDYPLHRYF